MSADEFSFEMVNGSIKVFCLSIAGAMVELFSISESEAIGRMNKQWGGVTIDGMVFHRTADAWAKTIYFEDGAFWWVEEWMAQNTPKPKPYP